MTFSAVEIDKLMSSTKPVGGMVWNVMGQIYIPKRWMIGRSGGKPLCQKKLLSPPMPIRRRMSLYLTEGELDMTLDGKEVHAGPGDIIPFPKYSTHALFNNCGETAKGIFWAEPTNKLFDLFKALHNVADPYEVVRISDDHDIHFQLPGQEPRTKKHVEAG